MVVNYVRSQAHCMCAWPVRWQSHRDLLKRNGRASHRGCGNGRIASLHRTAPKCRTSVLMECLQQRHKRLKRARRTFARRSGLRHHVIVIAISNFPFKAVTKICYGIAYMACDILLLHPIAMHARMHVERIRCDANGDPVDMVITILGGTVCSHHALLNFYTLYKSSHERGYIDLPHFSETQLERCHIGT
jgi:hypothetical protein